MTATQRTIRLIMLTGLVCALTVKVNAQNPNWAVNSGGFANSMNVVGFFWVDGVESTDANDVIAAFVNGEVRGVASPTYVDQIERYVVFLSVYSNEASGAVSFRAYDASEDKVLEIVRTVQFTPDDLIGGLEESFVWSNKELNSKAIFESFSIPVAYGDVAIDNLNVLINASLEVNEELSSQIATFVASSNAKVTIGEVEQTSGATVNDFSQTVTYRIQSEDLLTINEYQVTVTKVNRAPSALNLDNTVISENQSADLFVGTFSTIDEDTGDNHQYSFANGGADNGLFTINGGALVARSSLNYEDLPTRSIKVKSTDRYGKTIVKDFTIIISNANDLPTEIELSSVQINENSGVGIEVASLSTIDEDSGETFTYALVDGPGDADNELFEIRGNLLIAKSSFNHEEDDMLELRIKSTDSKSASITKNFEILVVDINDSPLVKKNIEDVLVAANNSISVIYPADIITDEDEGEQLNFSVAMGDGSTLPDWVIYIPENRALVFLPKVTHVGEHTFKIIATDSGGLSAEADFQVTVVLVLEIRDEENISDHVNVYPNPARDSFKLDASAFQGKPYTIALFNLSTGKMVFQEKGQKSKIFEVNTDSFLTGIYVIEAHSDSRVARRKVMIVR